MSAPLLIREECSGGTRVYDWADRGIKWSAVSSVQGVQLDYRWRRRGFQVNKVRAGEEVMKEGKRGYEGLMTDKDK